ncbi:hypothetical protein FB45DRAFT_1038852 [Roridomyces roridus]|uniref:Uncharacterized protein n=1 Tax=Roridomyces roridus TaxID=1738132 RepID=A0AAD7B3W9_9AGAR|nr:hypothetical protein FB45DRAFT_1038852 [Roridomyces roridus]
MTTLSPAGLNAERRRTEMDAFEDVPRPSLHDKTNGWTRERAQSGGSKTTLGRISGTSLLTPNTGGASRAYHLGEWSVSPNDGPITTRENLLYAFELPDECFERFDVFYSTHSHELPGCSLLRTYVLSFKKSNCMILSPAIDTVLPITSLIDNCGLVLFCTKSVHCYTSHRTVTHRISPHLTSAALFGLIVPTPAARHRRLYRYFVLL